MKKFFILSMLAFITILSLSCEKDEENVNAISKVENGTINNIEEDKEKIENEIDIQKNDEEDKVNSVGNSFETNNTPKYEFLSTRYVDDFTYFIPTNIENSNGGNYAVIITYSDYLNFAKNNNIDIDNDVLIDINEDYFTNNTIIVVIDTYEETYQHREFYRYIIDGAESNLYYEKTTNNVENGENSSGYWLYMIGISHEMLGITEVDRLPVNINVFQRE